MKQLTIISFTDRGYELAKRIQRNVEYDVSCYTKQKSREQQEDYVEESLTAWTRAHFREGEALLFIGAVGIAVRAIAGCVADKLTDPPVLSADEGGSFVIPILSGHYGGANALAQKVAERINAQAVITTATDVNQAFAADAFAGRHHLLIPERESIRRVAVRALAGEYIGVQLKTDSQEKIQERVVVSPFIEAMDQEGMWLIPKAFILGIGCRRDKSKEELMDFVGRILAEERIEQRAIKAIASIERKAREPGLLALAREWKVPFLTFTAEELEQVEGIFSSSDFVKNQVGVDNVCERAALAVCSGEKDLGGKGLAGDLSGSMYRRKTAENGMTLAIVQIDWSREINEKEDICSRYGTGNRRDDDTPGTSGIKR